MHITSRTANVLLFASALAVVGCVRAAHQSTVADLVISDVAVLNVGKGSWDSARTVVIVNGRIASINGKGSHQPAQKVIRGSGKFLIPGLWDMHVHLFDPRGVEPHHDPEHHLPLFVANGVTGVRDMWLDLRHLERAVAWQQQAARGELLAPRIVLTSPVIDGYPARWPNALIVRDAEEARRAVRMLAMRGLRIVKVYTNLSREAYFAVVDEATRAGLEVSGHVPGSVSAREALQAGQRTFEHLHGEIRACTSDEAAVKQAFDSYRAALERGAPRVEVAREFDRYTAKLLDASPFSPACQQLLKQFSGAMTWHTPTQINRRTGVEPDSQYTAAPELRYVPAAQRERWVATPPRRSGERAELGRRELALQLQFIYAMQRAGVRLLTGTDMGVDPWEVAGFSLHSELEQFVEAGLSPAEALRAATLHPAIYLNQDRDFGTLEAGKVADLILLDADPLADIKNTRAISAVILNGQLLDRGALDSLLVAAERRARD